MTRPASVLVAFALAASLQSAAQAQGSAQLLPDYMRTANPMIASPTWDDYLRAETVGDAVVFDGEALLELDAPVQAFDSATVPFAVRQRAGTDRITHLKIVVDENPMPMAAEFTFGDAMGEIALESRVRYDVFSNIRAIARVADGRSFMVGRFVQAAGGCSAAVSRDPVLAEATMGQMKLKHIDTSGGTSGEGAGTRRQAQLLIRHPNFTGMQVRTGTLEHIDARYVNLVEVHLDDALLFRMEGGFSISENPAFRFSYTDTGAREMRVRAVDSDGSEFTETFPLRSGA